MNFLRNTSQIEWELAKSKEFSQFYMNITMEDLRKIQKTFLDAFTDFHQFCVESDIDYAIVAGTLIGAIRHGGFIPWDDDVDVILPREDYENIAQKLSYSRFSQKYEIVFPEIDNNISLCAKFVIKNTSLATILGGNFSNTDKVYIDLLPVDRVPKNIFLKNLVGYTVNLLSISYASIRCWEKYCEHLYIMAKNNSTLKYNLLIRKFISLPALLIGRKNTLKLIHMLLQIGNGKEATVALGVKRYFGEIINYQDFFPTKEIMFEHLSVRAPNDSEAYLRNRYGDFMKIPDIQEQVERLVRLKGNWREFINE